jgi:hypothetical protein
MSEPVDQEIEAIKVVLAALAPLSEKARASVLDYVTKRLDLTPPVAPLPRVSSPPAVLVPAAPGSATRQALHIKDFKEQKRPRSANEMAAVVAYYLTNVAAPDQRKQTINQKDVETYFKIASFPLPQQLRMTLANAKNAGYFDLSGDGEYKLNAVGHNLVAHSMPRGASKAAGPTKRPRRQKAERARTKRS